MGFGPKHYVFIYVRSADSTTIEVWERFLHYGAHKIPKAIFAAYQSYLRYVISVRF
jgi:hypothetical protein